MVVKIPVIRGKEGSLPVNNYIKHYNEKADPVYLFIHPGK